MSRLPWPQDKVSIPAVHIAVSGDIRAHYTDKISDHIYTDEQARIRRERAAAEELLRRYEVKHDVITQTLDLALQLTDQTQDAYLQAEPTERRLFNQAFFERIEIDTEEITGHTLNAPYAQIRPLLNALPTQRPTRAATGRHTATTTRAAAKPARKGKTPGPHTKLGGSYLTLWSSGFPLGKRGYGAYRDRTDDLRLAKPTLSQLS